MSDKDLLPALKSEYFGNIRGRREKDNELRGKESQVKYTRFNRTTMTDERKK